MLFTGCQTRRVRHPGWNLLIARRMLNRIPLPSMGRGKGWGEEQRKWPARSRDISASTRQSQKRGCGMSCASFADRAITSAAKCRSDMARVQSAALYELRCERESEWRDARNPGRARGRSEDRMTTIAVAQVHSPHPQPLPARGRGAGRSKKLRTLQGSFSRFGSPGHTLPLTGRVVAETQLRRPGGVKSLELHWRGSSGSLPRGGGELARATDEWHR